MTRERPPYLQAGVIALAVFAIYLVTLAPTTAFWDTSEYIAAAKTLGIPHPPGNPLFVLLAHVFGLLPLAASYAERINLFAAVTSALGAGCWFLVSERWLRAVVPARWPRFLAAAAGVLVGATMWTVWNQSTVNEKVYTVSMFFMALVTWLAVHWGDDEPGAHRDRWLILIAYLLALTSTNHMMGVLAAPAVAIYVLWTDWRVLTRPWVLLGIGIVVIIGLTPNHVFLPIRAAQFPPINEGEPVGFNAICALSGGLAQCSQALADVLGRVQYGKPSVFDSPIDGTPRSGALVWAQLENYWQYFTWQFARDWGRLANVFAVAFAATGLYGLYQLVKRDRRAGLAAAAMFFTLTLALIFYLNFKYGYSIYPDRADITDEMREVRERDYFFVCSFAFFGTLVAAGLGSGMTAIARRFGGDHDGSPGWRLAMPLGAVALIPLFGNRVTATRDHEFAARDFARDLLESVEPYGILITAGDNDTFPLWYAQEVEGIRPDVTVANMSLMNTEWHLKQLRRREAPAFDPAKSIELWRQPDSVGIALGDSTVTAGGWIQPDRSVFNVSEDELNTLPEYVESPKQPIRYGNVTLQFRRPYLDRKDLATIFLIRDNLGRRPIYFSWSAGSFPDATLGLSPYLVSQGFVRKLYPGPVVPGGPVVQSLGMGFVDLDRSRSLLDKAYRWQSAARDRPRGWVDNPSRSILDLYGVIYAGVAETFRQHGDSATAARADSIAIAVARSLRPRGAALPAGAP
ncbi:MAG: DUF2723 domain-containing protein [Gemmatimonadetes bacterium]|nr:DUF2723 domain-containing protein [Gemmatimonadota bacterium]